MRIQVKKFKKINDVTIDLAPINIFIGANNSGKSSFIQGIQFAVSSCQTLGLKRAPWNRNNTRTSSLDSSEYLYIPTAKLEYLLNGRPLTGSRTREDRSWIEFVLSDDNNISSLKISRGKNGGFTTVLSGRDLGDILCNIDSPFCVYVPGIAGIPVLEKYEVAIAVKKSAARGDSNNYLRNILYTISVDPGRWSSFKASVNGIYGDIDFRVIFDQHVSEFINVYVVENDVELPLDSVGTGLLQVIQIFAYIEYFKPKIILLDEPDSHIHPTKQKLLANELKRRVESESDLKVVFSTHSRYILEALGENANVVHFQNGAASADVRGSEILLDIGACDADYLFSKRELEYVIVTEDLVDDVVEKKELLKKFMLANGLRESEFVLHSYEGCTKVHFAKILQGFVRKQIPTAKVILHVDRDQKVGDDREVLKLREDCRRNGIIFFMTKYQEMESYFCTPLHLHKIYGIDMLDANEKYNKFIDDLKVETKRKLSNFILRDRPELMTNSDGKLDIAMLNGLVDGFYEMYKVELTPGKELLGKIKNYVQNELKDDPNKILNISEGLISPEFTELLSL